jgi:hypothetical protein
MTIQSLISSAMRTGRFLPRRFPPSSGGVAGLSRVSLMFFFDAFGFPAT